MSRLSRTALAAAVAVVAAGAAACGGEERATPDLFPIAVVNLDARTVDTAIGRNDAIRIRCGRSTVLEAGNAHRAERVVVRDVGDGSQLLAVPVATLRPGDYVLVRAGTATVRDGALNQPTMDPHMCVRRPDVVTVLRPARAVP